MLRDVVEDPRYTEDFDSLHNVYAHMDDVHLSITWALARDPRIGSPLPGFPDFRVYRTTSIGATPQFQVLYTFGPETVTLLGIEIA